ncbi:MAG: endopeptidase La [Clostridiales bacterium]|nr:endopeptidase La [Clostridiales bacterium]
MSELRKNIPAIALRGMTVLPGMIVHFDISRKKSIKAVEQSMMRDQKILLISQKDAEIEYPEEKDLYRIGMVAVIRQVVKMPRNMFRILAEGLDRAELIQLGDCEEYLEAETELLPGDDLEQYTLNMQEAMLRGLKDIFLVYSEENDKINREAVQQILEITKLNRLVEQIAINIPMYFEEKQRLLEAENFQARYDALCMFLTNEIEILRIRKDIQIKVKERVDKNQREYILREQLKLIREELGEDTTLSDIDQFQEKAKRLKASAEVKEKIEKEIERLKNVGNHSSESAVIRGYIETLLDMPWENASYDRRDIKTARKILEEDHYGLWKVKERILEFLAVRSLTAKGESPIICLVGPPGTGKTSIARSIARALDKKYVRISLGGVRDEAEIRGHRRTYVGAMPGRIAAGMKTAGVKNPLMLLDEIDKVSGDYKGDTASALLEVLDSEQNVHFQDHYIEIPLNLSEVLFIATANDAQSIPRPLLDRMEIIEITSYTENEKFHIAKEHLVKKQIERNGLDETDIQITDNALRKVISGYTKEAGVRNLERKLDEICRKAAKEILEDKKKFVKVTEARLPHYLGKEKYSVKRLNDSDEIGIVRGLAWTSVGGETLQIEVNVMDGKGEFVLTGQLGDVMKESARTGISYIRSVRTQYNIESEFFEKHDIHIHIPEGAVPKDGPSAGITMATAMLSAITGIPVRADAAMTGEITLRGRVLPIGGLKEKMLAAKNAGIRTVIVPQKNKADVEEISGEIKKGMEIVYAETMEDVLFHALVKKEKTEER